MSRMFSTKTLVSYPSDVAKANAGLLTTRAAYHGTKGATWLAWRSSRRDRFTGASVRRHVSKVLDDHIDFVFSMDIVRMQEDGHLSPEKLDKVVARVENWVTLRNQYFMPLLESAGAAMLDLPENSRVEDNGESRAGLIVVMDGGGGGGLRWGNERSGNRWTGHPRWLSVRHSYIFRQITQVPCKNKRR